ncbi:MAG: hypothetical protein AAGM38_13690 [Pseudomonadota bacterium]
MEVTEVAGVPFGPLVAFLFGVLVLIKADILNWIVALLLIGYGVVYGLMPVAGLEAEARQIIDFIHGVTRAG